MSYIVFENPGEADLAALTTFGVSVKTSSSPIGFFGTGFKYAVSVLLRLQCQIEVLSGKERVKFDKRRITIRNEEFDIVLANEEKLGFTTHLGITWQPWMAYRELLCNAQDEGGRIYTSTTRPAPQRGMTYVVCQGREIEEAYNNQWRYFISTPPIATIGTMQIHSGTSLSYFYRGVCVQQYKLPSLFTYNDLARLDLTEDRTVKSSYECNWRIVKAITTCEDPAIIKAVLLADSRKFLEGSLDFNDYGISPGDVFCEIAEKLMAKNHTAVNFSARKSVEAIRKTKIELAGVKMTSIEEQSLERALDFCECIGFSIRGSFPIRVSDTLGLAKDEIIYVARRAFEMGGTKQVAAVLIEEWAHLKFGYADCTREMQNWLFERIVHLGETILGKPL
jgi:hypothetical protein